MSRFRAGGERRSFNVLIYEEDYKELCAWVLKKPNIETGGDLFGLWADKHTAVIQMVLGPGSSCTRTTVSFYQDIDYLRRVGSYLIQNEGVCHIGEWHSHHQLGLARPSESDENTVWNNMPTYNVKRFVIFIANIRSSQQSYNVNVGCFLFEYEEGKRMDVLPGTFTILEKNSPLSRKIEVSQEIKKGAEKDYGSKIAIKELKMEVKEGGKRPSVVYFKPKPTATASERKRVTRGNYSQPANQYKPNNEKSSVDSKKRKMNTEERSPEKSSGNGKTLPEELPPCEDLKNLAINNEPQEETSEEAMEQEKEKEQPEKNSQEELKHELEEQHDGERGKSQGKKAGNIKENDEAASPQGDQVTLRSGRIVQQQQQQQCVKLSSEESLSEEQREDSSQSEWEDISDSDGGEETDELGSLPDELKTSEVDNTDSAGPSVLDVRPEVFISYEWDLQNTVKLLKNKLEESGFQCWMDICQMGGGDRLFAEIDAGIRGSKVVICCVTQRYCKSEMCQREVTLADSLKKPIIPLLFESIDWPPAGQLALIFTELLYIDMSQGVASNFPENKLEELYLKVKDHIQR